ncbi:hypothetical protein L6R53_24965 [Myxococcota bacterium]|nr:hypothetical protein [Myxococcota bacterium]
MSADGALRERLDQALDQAGALDRPGVVQVDGAGYQAEIEARRIESIGVVVERLRVSGAAGTVAERAAAVAEGLRPQGERLVPVEVDPTLGGAVLRTRPEDMQRGRFYQVELDPAGATVQRVRRAPEGRVVEPFAITRDELERMIEGLGAATAPPPSDEG